MHQQRYPSSAPPPKPSKLLILLALIATGLLPYWLIKTHKGEKDNAVVQEAILVPQLDIQAPGEKTKAVEKVTAKEAPAEDDWVSLKTQPGDTLSSIFKREGLNVQALHSIIQDKKYTALLTRIKPNQSVELLIKKHELERMILQVNRLQTLEISRVKGVYQAKLSSQKMEVRDKYLTATVQYSLYSTAKRHNIPYKLIQQMTDIFKQEINFAKDIRGGDRFSIIYKASYIDNTIVSAGDIIAVTYTNRGVTHQAFRHVNAAGEVDYFTPDGKSMRPGFSRYPVKFSRINSPFSLSRMHPILHYNRPHRGIDLAAPMGTPVYATGDGRVAMMGYENGYGNVIKITHHNTLYTSVYAHLMKFQKGIFRGGYVKRGQLIGFVGKSGLASGPHCHYELHVNHQPRNPRTVALPSALPVPSRDLASFKAHADKLIEHLKLFEEAHSASKKSHGHAVG